MATAVPRRRKSSRDLVAELHIDPAAAAKLGFLEKPVAVDDDEHPSDFCTRAASIALRAMGARPDDVGLILSTCVSQEYMPSWTNAVEVAGKLGAGAAVAFDVQLGCAATVAALEIVRDRAPSGPPLAVIVGAERWSHTLSPLAPFPPALMAHADGGGALVIGDGAALSLGPSAIEIEPSYNDYLVVPAGGTREPTSADTVARHRHFRTSARHVEGRTLVDRYTRGYRKIIARVLERVPEERRTIDVLIMNQIRPTMRAEVYAALEVPASRTVSSYERLGHLGGADMFAGLELAWRQRLFGDDVAILSASSLPAFGAMAILRGPGVDPAVSAESAIAALAP